MAQKETSSKSRRWLGLSGAAVLVANLVLTGTTIAFQQEGEVNHALGIEGAGIRKNAKCTFISGGLFARAC